MGRNRHKGFSLVELLIALAVFNLLLFGLFTWLQTGANIYRQTAERSENQYDAEQALELISSCIRQSASKPELLQSTLGNTDTLLCSLAGLNKRGEFTGVTRQVKILLRNGVICRSVDGGAAQPLTAGTMTVGYQWQANGCILVTVTAGYGTDEPCVLQTAVYPRISCAENTI